MRTRQIFTWATLLLFILIGVQQAKAVIYLIPSDTTIGTWDPVTRTYTLTKDVDDTIEVVDSELTLDGAGYTVTGNGGSYGVYLSGRTGVTIKNLNVQKFCLGILASSSRNITLTDNTASNNYIGIQLQGCNDNKLTGNTANANADTGIVLTNNSSYNTLTGNTTLNNWYGIWLGWSISNTLTANTASNNGHGIGLQSSSNNTLTGNTVKSNDPYGIWLWVFSSNNEIYNNNFIDNTTQAYAYYGCSGNLFNLDKPIGGNFWSNWTTPDDDVDGFVDFPYVFTGGKDNLPWTRQGGWKDSDGDGVPDDADNCPDVYNPDQLDADGDGIGDVCDPDDDNDGLTDEEELEGWDITIHNCDGSVKETYHVTSDPYQADEDGDGLTDLEEKEGWHVKYIYQVSPGPPPESEWIEYDVTSNPHYADIDIDGKNDKQEKSAKTDPSRANTDCDGHWDTNDGFEVDYGLNPLDFDTDNDGLSDGLEIDLWIMAAGYDPEQPELVPPDVLSEAADQTNDPVIPAVIDIKPGSYPNELNLSSHGLIPVAILTTEYFDATTVDPDTVVLAGSGVAVRGKGSKLMAHEEDVNGDSLLDLIVQLETENLDPESFQDGYAVLTGQTYNGVPIEGQDEITIVSPEE